MNKYKLIKGRVGKYHTECETPLPDYVHADKVVLVNNELYCYGPSLGRWKGRELLAVLQPVKGFAKEGCYIYDES